MTDTLKNFTILYIEDNEANATVVQRVVERWTIHLLRAATAEEGLEMAYQHHPDIILMDIRLPGIDGLMATRLIKQDADLRHIPVIALTASTDVSLQDCLDAGCSELVTKPITVAKLIDTVRKYWVQA